LEARSWLTQIPTHAIVHAEKRAKSDDEEPYILVVEAEETDVRRPNESDRSDENRGNDFDRDDGVRISTNALPVLECLTIADAKRRFTGAHNLLGPQ